MAKLDMLAVPPSSFIILLHVNVDMLLCPSLRERVYRSNASIASTWAALPTLARSGVYKSWSEKQMDRALNAVVSEGLNVRRSALQLNVPKSPLGDRVSGHVLPDSSNGPLRYLTTAEEKDSLPRVH